MENLIVSTPLSKQPSSSIATTQMQQQSAINNLAVTVFNVDQRVQQYPDVKGLQTIQMAFNTLFNDCIKLTDWSNLEEVRRHKILLFERLSKCMIAGAHKLQIQGGIGPTQQNQLSQGQETQDESTQSTDFNRKESIFQYETQQKSMMDPHGLYTAKQDYKQIFPSSSHYTKREHRDQPPFSPQSDSDYQGEGPSSDDEYGQSHRQTHGNMPLKRKYIYKKPREYKFSYPHSLPESTIQLHTTPPKSINGFPTSEKIRVLAFFNDHYDPAKRNKIELIHRIVHQFNYSYSSIYYLVTNQKALNLTPNQVPYQTKSQFQSNASQHSVRPLQYQGTSLNQFNRSAPLSYGHPSYSHQRSTQPYNGQTAISNHQQQLKQESFSAKPQTQPFNKAKSISGTEHHPDNDLFRDDLEIKFNRNNTHLTSQVGEGSINE